MASILEKDRAFITRGELVMTLDGLARGAEWRMRVKNDTESEGAMAALREIAERSGVALEVMAFKKGLDSESLWFEDTVSVNALENDSISRRRVKELLHGLYEKYAVESKRAYKSESLRRKKLALGKFNAVVALQINLRY
jgi:hypothetical protein